MQTLIAAIQVAGVLHLLVASVNFFAFRKFGYRENLQKVSPIVREVFLVQNAYIVLVLAGFALLCFFFAADLAGGSLLGRCLSGFLALFWGLRIGVQLFLYDSRLRRENRLFDLLFLAVFVYLTVVFALGACGFAGELVELT
jgi:hypothetical protein